MYNSILDHLYIALCIHHPSPNILKYSVLTCWSLWRFRWNHWVSNWMFWSVEQQRALGYRQRISEPESAQSARFQNISNSDAVGEWVTPAGFGRQSPKTIQTVSKINLFTFSLENTEIILSFSGLRYTFGVKKGPRFSEKVPAVFRKPRCSSWLSLYVAVIDSEQVDYLLFLVFSGHRILHCQLLSFSALRVFSSFHCFCFGC